ncbi:MAG: hypothetical protein K2X52_30355 [Mycobacteriaceae bacterium]|uniref:hypothetical protein n=1 Tax=Mycolicibacterium sp. GF69 TaxID=2267251 RepID=UPI00140290B6|nr:hypothetical protein [Mycolicibacterium sp. GF69]MBY0291409.1 hypothetical protein [Mycobacteriaceae bacterium]
MPTPTPNRSPQVASQAIDEDLLDTAYAQLAPAFNTQDTNAERRAARDTYASRRES